MNCMTALSGATFIQPATIEYQGRKALVFPFAVSSASPQHCVARSLTTTAFQDLAVKTEGQFFLRYRYFDIFSRTSGHGDLPIQAECFGGPFRIYSTKEFPGLRPSTELTKVASWFRCHSTYLLTRRSKATRSMGRTTQHTRNRA